MESARISVTGRGAMAVAMTLDHDWNNRCSGEDRLVEEVSVLSDHDLDAAAQMVACLAEAIACMQLRREAERDT